MGVVAWAAEVYQPCPAEVDALIPTSSPDTRVPDSVVTKVRDRLLTGQRCIIRLNVQRIVAASLVSASDVGIDDETQ
jgi:hypothetical protein